MSVRQSHSIPLARKLRKTQTDTEVKLWSLLRNRSLLGYKFRRQRPIGPYIADFCCMKPKLIIEADGSQHLSRIEYDSIRTKFMEKQGFMIIRFWDNDILVNPSTVLEVILATINTLTLPSPKMGEGKKLKNFFQ